MRLRISITVWSWFTFMASMRWMFSAERLAIICRAKDIVHRNVSQGKLVGWRKLNISVYCEAYAVTRNAACKGSHFGICKDVPATVMLLQVHHHAKHKHSVASNRQKMTCSMPILDRWLDFCSKNQPSVGDFNKCRHYDPYNDPMIYLGLLQLRSKVAQLFAHGF